LRLTTPVAFLIFKRPDLTRRVFEAIRWARPSRLLVVADGARPDRPGEAEQCRAARAVVEGVDWECEVLTDYAEVNLGCRRRISSGLDWVFGQVEEAIVLEDDCLPDPTFFRFCAELLESYRQDERVMVVSGDSFQDRRSAAPYSYYFSRFSFCWGWATWRRAWRHYDRSMTLWPALRDGPGLGAVLEESRAASYWSAVFDAVYAGAIDTWDYVWLLSCWSQSGLTVLPGVNLVSNIGFDAQATHTMADSPLMELPTAAMTFPLRHPPWVVRDARADALDQRVIFGTRAVWSRALGRLRRAF
jgi:hypothetical protein